MSHRIRDVAIFEKLSADSLTKLVTLLNPIAVSAGEAVVLPGDVGSEMFIVMAGECQVVNTTGDLVCILTQG